MYAQVVIDIRTRALTSLYSYKIPERFPRIVEGSAVLCEFNKRLVVGFVVGLSAELPEELASKEDRIASLIDALPEPFFDAEVITLANFLAARYGGSLIEAYLPFIAMRGQTQIDTSEGKPRLKLLRPTLRYESRYSLVADAEPPRSSAHKQIEIVELLKAAPRSHSELGALVQGAAPALRALVAKGTVVEEKDAVLKRRADAAELMFWDYEPADQAKVLNDEQAAAYTRIATHFDEHKTFVLDGVTGSGKTEIYLQLISQVLPAGKTALVLIPEISLTYQTVRRFSARFPDQVAVIHSRLSEAEKKTQLELIMTGAARVLVGARSALFAPLENLGIIIIDEEHDESYKQGSAPRYHARDLAQKRAEFHKIPLILGSATPSLESFYQVEQGAWELLSLKKRVNAQDMPEVSIIDMADEFRKKSRSVFSHELIEALQEVYDKKQKAILLLNRRGTAAFFLCRDCGYVPKCEDCSTSLTYHGSHNHLRCHSCDRIEPIPASCPNCGSHYLLQMGAGTQAIEQELSRLFPNWSVIRMDADSTKGPGGHEQVLADFDAQESAVLIGTQMIAKGHDFPQVTLVGVIMADIGLHFSDFRASEASYQLLEQVSGRAGRSSLKGRVLIQSYLPNHPVLRAVATHDRDLFIRPEMEMRKELRYPPYARLVNIIASAYKAEDALDYLEKLKTGLETDERLPGLTILGPTSSLFSKIKKRYRYHLVIKAERSLELGALLNEHMVRLKAPQNLNLALDVDPMSLV